ncbi:MAG: protein kinase [Gammaproteobacteria bacterium]|nr:protein kinase [Gammaproteobacteria bacterium]
MTFLTAKKTWVTGLVLTLLLTLAAALQWGRGPERLAFVLGTQLTPRHPPSADVVIVGIDNAALDRFGPWPWPRSVLAKITDTLSADKTRVIAFVPEFSDPQNTLALAYLSRLSALDDVEQSPAAKALVGDARAALATDAEFAYSIRNAGNVILAATGVRNPAAAAAPHLPAWFANKAAVSSAGKPDIMNRLFGPPDVLLQLPLAQLAEAADGIGYLPADAQNGPRALLVNNGAYVVPSLALLVAARDLGLKNRDIVPSTLGGLDLGSEFLFTDAHMQALSRNYAAGENRAVIPVYPFNDVYSDQVPSENLTGKVVLVGLTTDVGGSTVMHVASMVSSILNGDLVATPFWAWWLRALLMLLVGAYLVLALPRLGVWVGAAASVVVLILLANGEFIPLISRGLWLPLVMPALFLVIGHAVVLTARHLQSHHGVSREDLSESNRKLALACQALGHHDEALRNYVKCMPSRALYENLLSLGHEHERHRRYTEAIEVYLEMKQRLANFGSVEDRLRRLEALESQSTVTHTRRGKHEIALLDDGLQKPVLGRYELIRELGRGAMGVVYLGRDQKIGRTVAIKTMPLAAEFSGDALKEVSQRFFREAETAGLLNHPNIVTIYDVGEDQGLAYIAMDFLPGEPLQSYTLPGRQMPLDEVLAITIKIAEALDYAHGRQVVHRDIKPANIMYERQTGRLKITDFGVAAVANANKTRTGTILGSPSYMSPEQVAGKKVDGRSDLYSLGVTLYQLMRGELPFEAPSLTGLMFKISNEQPPDVTFLRPDIPAVLREAVEKALQKNPDARYQTGMEMANSLRQSRGKLKRTS